MKRRPRRRYRAIRRVPQAYPGLYLRLKVAPVLPALAATVAVGALAEISALPQDVRARARSLSDDMGTAISEQSQRIFFDTPGLDTLLIRSLSHVARRTERSSPSARTRTGAWPACCPSSPGADMTPS